MPDVRVMFHVERHFEREWRQDKLKFGWERAPLNFQVTTEIAAQRADLLRPSSVACCLNRRMGQRRRQMTVQGSGPRFSTQES